MNMVYEVASWANLASGGLFIKLLLNSPLPNTNCKQSNCLLSKNIHDCALPRISETSEIFYIYIARYTDPWEDIHVRIKMKDDLKVWNCQTLLKQVWVQI